MAVTPLRLVIGYGSESGNARRLAQALGAMPALQAHTPTVQALNDVDPQTLPPDTLLVVIASSFGAGDPPGNAERFQERAQQAMRMDGLRYAIFGLGDTAYPNFCGFTRRLDTRLQALGAEAWLSRVDADANYEDFFARWVPVLQQVLAGDRAAGQTLHLRVTAYDANAAFSAPLLERRQLNRSQPGAWHLRLDIAGSGMAYRAGDNLYVLPGNDPALLQALAEWYGDPAATERLADRELRQLGKGLLRELARLSQHEALKALLKISQRQALDDYLWGADLLDVLQDFCTPAQIPLAQLVGLLPTVQPRAYSIASAGGDTIDLCLREVSYTRGERPRRGCATGWLLHHDGPVRVFCRANPDFHLPRDPTTPLLLIGTGTGIAPLMGLLRESKRLREPRRRCLVFGERHSDRDFLFREELHDMLGDGTLSTLHTAFSRSGASKYYVQHALRDQRQAMHELLLSGAHIYLCGNKRHLERAVADAINDIMANFSILPDGETGWQWLEREGRLHRELY